MHLSKKQQLFSGFIANWGREFREALFVVKYIVSHPKLHARLDHFKPINESNYELFQMEWIWLISRFDHPLDTEFFQPCFVPVETNKYDLFLDISDGHFTLFEVCFDIIKPSGWLKQVKCNDVRDLMISETLNDLQIDAVLQAGEKAFIAERARISAWRRQIGYAGKIDFRKFEPEDFFDGEEAGYALQKNDVLTVTRVNARIFSLLPATIGFRLVEFSHDAIFTHDIFAKAKNLNGLIYLLEERSVLRVHACKIEFTTGLNGFACWENETFTLHCNDLQLMDRLREKITKYREVYIENLLN